MSDDFIEEIKEEVRYDQLKAIWDEYGNYIIGIILTIFLASVGYVVWHSQKEQRVLEQTLKYEKALEAFAGKDSPKDMSNLDDLIKDGSLGYKVLSIFKKAGETTSESEIETILAEVTDDKSIDAFYRDLARLQIIMQKFDSNNAKMFLDELEILANSSSKVQTAALELQGFAYIKLSAFNRARESFDQILKSDRASQAMKVRARAMLETLG